MKNRTLPLIAVCLFSFLVPFVSFGQTQTSTQTSTQPNQGIFSLNSNELPRVSKEPATLVFENREIATLRGELTGITPKIRVSGAESRLEELSDVAIRQKVMTRPLGNGIVISVGPSMIVILFPEDLDPNSGKTLQQTADDAVAKLTEALQAKLDQRRLPVILKGIGLSLLGTLGFGALFLFLLRARKYVLDRFSRLADQPAGFKLLGVELRSVVRTILEALSRLALLVAAIIVFYLWLTYILRCFPYTYPWGQALRGFLFHILGQLAAQIKKSFPGLTTVLIIFFIARVLTKAVKQFFDGLESGKFQMAGLYAETAGATRRLINALIWIFALVVAYPYFPGSQTDAFKGISVFLGLMFTLGSAGIVNHLMSGLVLVYSRAFKKGDIIRVGEQEGRVMEVGPLSVKIATKRREELTIPNTVITGSVVTNYSRLSKEDGLILTTKITIGYDAPWRQVQEMLKLAANRTPGLRKSPAPFVLQTALSDFYVEYTLCISPEDPEERLIVLSHLHANIQDAFNEYGVQIMSPNFEAQPHETVIVPKEKWYTAPAKKPDEDKKE